MDAVVVLPWVPATARHRFSEAIEARAPGPGQHGDARGAGLGDLGVVLGDGRGHGDHVGGADIPGGVAEGHGDPDTAQPLGHRRGLEVAAGDGVPHGVQGDGDGTHPRAADPHHVDGDRAARVAERTGPGGIAHDDPFPAAGRGHSPPPPGRRRRRRRAGPPMPPPGPMVSRAEGSSSRRSIRCRPASRRRTRRRAGAPTPRPVRGPGRWPSGGRRGHRAAGPGWRARRRRRARPRSSPRPGTPPGPRPGRPGPCGPRRGPSPGRDRDGAEHRHRPATDGPVVGLLVPVPTAHDVVDGPVEAVLPEVGQTGHGLVDAPGAQRSAEDGHGRRGPRAGPESARAARRDPGCRPEAVISGRTGVPVTTARGSGFPGHPTALARANRPNSRLAAPGTASTLTRTRGTPETTAARAAGRLA